MPFSFVLSVKTLTFNKKLSIEKYQHLETILLKLKKVNIDLKDEILINKRKLTESDVRCGVISVSRFGKIIFSPVAAPVVKIFFLESHG